MYRRWYEVGNRRKFDVDARMTFILLLFYELCPWLSCTCFVNSMINCNPWECLSMHLSMHEYLGYCPYHLKCTDVDALLDWFLCYKILLKVKFWRTATTQQWYPLLVVLHSALAIQSYVDTFVSLFICMLFINAHMTLVCRYQNTKLKHL